MEKEAYAKQSGPIRCFVTHPDIDCRSGHFWMEFFVNTLYVFNLFIIVFAVAL